MGTLRCLQVGCADASVISTTATFLVDCHRIEEHEDKLPADKTIRVVFITHQHRDHYSGLEFLRRKRYGIQFLVCSPYDRRQGDTSVTPEEWKEFADHRDHFKAQGTKLYQPFKQDNFAKPWWENAGLRFWMLGPDRSLATSATRELHDACLVLKVDMGERHCLFTGDASDANLQGVATINHNCDDILHASHHGSLEGADLDFIKSTNAKYTVISTEPGVHDNVPHPTALRRYQENSSQAVYRTDLHGSVKFSF